jgi:cytochrome c oxidase assembly protein subunit 11
MQSDLDKKNKRLMISALLFVAFMIGLSFASVPLYRKLCQITGWGGTTQEVKANPFTPQGRTFTVRFNADTDPALPWSFKPDLLSVQVRAGQDGFISYKAENKGSAPVTGTAVYNVTPLEAGRYFYKTQCFCFGEQTLAPKASTHMPVVFFIDPSIAQDPNLKDLTTITLSYTFYKKDTAALDKAVENFGNKADTLAR